MRQARASHDGAIAMLPCALHEHISLGASPLPKDSALIIIFDRLEPCVEWALFAALNRAHSTCVSATQAIGTESAYHFVERASDTYSLFLYCRNGL